MQLAPARMIVTICTSCNRTAPEYDKYQAFAQNLLAHIAAGVTLIRIISWDLAAKRDVPDKAHDWVGFATDLIHAGNDLREGLEAERQASVHKDCPEYKQMTRRINALLSDLDFMRQDLIGHFVPK